MREDYSLTSVCMFVFKLVKCSDSRIKYSEVYVYFTFRNINAIFKTKKFSAIEKANIYKRLDRIFYIEFHVNVYRETLCIL